MLRNSDHVPNLATRSNLVRHASDIDLARIQAPTQVLGSWTNRINMRPEVHQDKTRARVNPFQAPSSNVTAAPATKTWIREFRHKWRQEQLRSRYPAMWHSPTDMSMEASGMPDDGTDQEDGLVFRMDDIAGVRTSNGGSQHASTATAASQTECSPLNHQDQWQHTWANGPPAHTLQRTTTRPVAIRSRPLPRTSLLMHHQRLHAQQPQQLKRQQSQLPPQQQQQPQQKSTWEIRSEQRHTEVQPVEQPKLSTATQTAKVKNLAGSPESSSTAFVSTARLQSPRHSGSRPQAQADTSDSTASHSEVSETTAAACDSNRSDKAALQDIAGLAPIRRAIMRGNGGKLKASARVYKAELPPQYSRASQAA